MFLKSTNSPAPSTASTNSKPPATKRSVPTVVSADMHVLGNIVSEGIVDFDGTIDGNIRCSTLVIRHNGRVNGEVHAENVQVYGKVKGLLKAKSVQLHSNCCVEGIVMHEAISIEDGAVIDGKIKRTNKAVASTATAANSSSSPIPGMVQEFEEMEDNNESGGSGTENMPKLLENIRLIAG